MIRVFIGYEPAETVAFHVLAHSILRRASRPVSVTGLVLGQLPMWRERDPRQSTEFAFSRFIVPHLCGYEGRAVFMDCDMLARADIVGLWHEMPSDQAVGVVQHHYVPRDSTKFLDQQQTAYARKNWSSVMVFNNERCRALTPEYVNSAPGLDLHQFRWLPDEEIHALPPEWNHLVGEYEPNPDAKLVHFTQGTPCFKRFRQCEYADEWFEELDAMNYYDRKGEFSRPPRIEA